MTVGTTTFEDLDPEAWAEMENSRFSRPRLVSTIPSTNTALVEEAAAGGDAGTVLIAQHQSAGKGRLDRTWSDHGSALLCSVLLRPRLSHDSLPLLGLAAALSMSQACMSLCGTQPECKWPNDLILGDRKVGGVLAEIVNGPRASFQDLKWPAVVVGIGLNISGALSGALQHSATTLAHHTDSLPGREALAARYLVTLDDWLTRLEQSGGQKRFIEEYRKHCITLGQMVKVTRAGGDIFGMAESMSWSGALSVRLADGNCILVRTGDVQQVRAQ